MPIKKLEEVVDVLVDLLKKKEGLREYSVPELEALLPLQLEEECFLDEEGICLRPCQAVGAEEILEAKARLRDA